MTVQVSNWKSVHCTARAADTGRNARLRSASSCVSPARDPTPSFLTRKPSSGSTRSRSAGIPRLVNLLCAQGLSVAASRQTTRVTPRMIEDAAARIWRQGPGKRDFFEPVPQYEIGSGIAAEVVETTTSRKLYSATFRIAAGWSQRQHSNGPPPQTRRASLPASLKPLGALRKSIRKQSPNECAPPKQRLRRNRRWLPPSVQLLLRLPVPPPLPSLRQPQSLLSSAKTSPKPAKTRISHVSSTYGKSSLLALEHPT